MFTNPEIANLIQYGIEGEDYSIDNNGNLVVSGDSMAVNLFGRVFTNSLITYSSSSMADNKAEYQNWFMNTYALDFPFGFRFNPSSVSAEIKACNRVLVLNNFNEPPSTTYQRISTLQTTDIDKEVDQLVQELQEAGIDRIIAEANKQLKEWKGDR